MNQSNTFRSGLFPACAAILALVMPLSSCGNQGPKGKPDAPGAASGTASGTANGAGIAAVKPVTAPALEGLNGTPSKPPAEPPEKAGSVAMSVPGSRPGKPEAEASREKPAAVAVAASLGGPDRFLASARTEATRPEDFRIGPLGAPADKRKQSALSAGMGLSKAVVSGKPGDAAYNPDSRDTVLTLAELFRSSGEITSFRAGEPVMREDGSASVNLRFFYGEGNSPYARSTVAEGILSPSKDGGYLVDFLSWDPEAMQGREASAAPFDPEAVPEFMR